MGEYTIKKINVVLAFEKTPHITFVANKFQSNSHNTNKLHSLHSEQKKCVKHAQVQAPSLKSRHFIDKALCQQPMQLRLKLALLSRPASRASNVQKSAQYVFLL